MDLDRALIKSQAKQLVKGKIWTLFLISFVVCILAGGVSSATEFGKAVYDYKDTGLPGSFGSSQKSSSGDLEHYFDGLDDYDSNGSSGSNSGENSSSGSGSRLSPRTIGNTIGNYINYGAKIIGIVCAPLSIALCGVYLMLVKGNPLNVSKEFSYTFKNTFSKGYFNRFLLIFFQALFTALWSLLLVIPGIVYVYKIAFAEFIQTEYPRLSWKECLNLSKKLTDGHKSELFVLDLSFIPWLLLTIITCGLAQIYVAPYYLTVKALYYENFKQRALQTGEAVPEDFMSEEERYAQYLNNPQNSRQGYYNPVNNYNNQTYSQNTQYAQNQPYEQAQQNYYNYGDNNYNVQPPTNIPQNGYAPAQPVQTEAAPQAENTAYSPDYPAQGDDNAQTVQTEQEAQDTAVQVQADAQPEISVEPQISDNDISGAAQDEQSNDSVDSQGDSFTDGENKDLK